MQSCRYKFFFSLQMSRETRDTLIHRNGKVSDKSNKRKKGTIIMQRKKFMIQLPSHERGKKKKKLTVAVVILYNYVVNILCSLFFFFYLAFSVTIVRVSWTGQGRGFSLSDSAREGREREDIHSGNGFNEATPSYSECTPTILAHTNRRAHSPSLLLTYGTMVRPSILPKLGLSQLRHSSCCSWPQCPGPHCACVLYLIFLGDWKE